MSQEISCSNSHVAGSVPEIQRISRSVSPNLFHNDTIIERVSEESKEEDEVDVFDPKALDEKYDFKQKTDEEKTTVESLSKPRSRKGTHIPNHFTSRNHYKDYMEVKLELNESVSSPKYLTQSQGLAQKVKVELYRKPTKFGPRV